MPARDAENLRTLFDEQMAFLRSSAEAYDRGFEAEAKRLAVTLRTLVHDTPRSHGLLSQLGIKERLRWTNSALPINPANLLPTNGLGIVHMRAGDGRTEARYVPAFDHFPEGRAQPPVPFDVWWSTDVTKDERGNLFSRRDFVLTVANKEGGAHVDPRLNAAYQHLTEGNSLGVRVVDGADEAAERLEAGKAAEGNAALVSVRQIAWEVLKTLDEQAPFLLHADGDPRRPASRLRDDSPCPCGSGRDAGSCHLADAEDALGLGNALLATAPLEAAFAFRRSADLGHPKGPFNLGLALHAVGDYDAAERAFADATDRGDASGASNLGILRQQMGDEAGALAAFEAGAELGGVGARMNLATLHEQAERGADAEAIYRALFDEGDHEAGLRLGALLRKRGDMASARTVYEQLASSGDARAEFNLAIADHARGDVESATSRLRSLAESEEPEIAGRARQFLQSLAP